MENNQFFEQGIRPLNLKPVEASMLESANTEAENSQHMRFYNLSFGKEFFFKVLTTPVLYDDHTGLNHIVSFPKKKVIIDATEHKGISIVRKGFYVVSHEEAMQLGCRIFQEIFGLLPSIHQQNLSASKTDYTVDLVSDECKIVIDRDGFHYQNPYRDDYRRDLIQSEIFPFNDARVNKYFRDVYHPFLRVSNYLRDGVSMVIQMGYYRSRCSNGMLFDLTLPLRFTHTYFVSSYAKIELDALRYFKLNERYLFTMAEQLWKLLYVPVQPNLMRVIPYDIFRQYLEMMPLEKQRKLLPPLQQMVDRYVQELGQNMNAAINVATDFSKLLVNSRISADLVQRLTGEWLNKVNDRHFNWDDYQKVLESRAKQWEEALSEN